MSFTKGFTRFLASFIALSLLVFVTTPAESAKKAQQPAKSVVSEDLQKTLALLRQTQDPVAQKLVTWLFATETEIPVDPGVMMQFANDNPAWPRLHQFRDKIEKNIKGAASDDDIINWFTQNPPVGFDGIKAYIDALQRKGRKPDAVKFLNDFWPTANIGKNEAAALAGAYNALFTREAHAKRLDTLLWEGRYDEADFMLAFVGPETRALGRARMSLGQMAKSADADLQNVPPHLQQHEALLYERTRYRRRKDMTEGAIDILKMLPQTQQKPEKWWEEIRVLVRRKMEEKDYAAAYALAQKHQLSQGAEYAQAEWIMGWLELRRLHQPEKAFQRFSNIYQNVTSAISKSRAAYWAGRAAEAMHNTELATQWHKLAATYPSTYYGQLSFVKIYGKPFGAFADPAITPEAAKTFTADERVRAIRILHKNKMARFVDPFFARLIADAQDDATLNQIAALARETGRHYYAVESNKQAQQRLGKFLMKEGYPLLPSLPLAKPERALVHAIIHRESMFDTKAVSHAGARGMMQLMPATAKSMAQKTKRAYKFEKLTDDPVYNVLLGSTYLQQLINNYNGYYPMAIAAYNAGPGNVAKWVKQFGDPRKGDMDVIDWVEHIPIYETRNYVQRVMESYFIYRLRNGEEPRIITSFHTP